MKVQEFIAQVCDGKRNVRDVLKVQDYIPVMQKKQFAINLLAECTYDDDYFIRIDGIKQAICFDMRIIGLYTNLEIATDFKDVVEQYDMLSKNHLLQSIVVLFEDEYIVMEKIVADVLNELMEENSINAQVTRIVGKINSLINNIGDANELPQGDFDMNKFIEAINMLK